MSLLYDKLAEADADPRAVLVGEVNRCSECGCDDNHTCVDARGRRCAWFLMDIATPTGVCTFCAHRLGADQPFMCDRPVEQAA